MVKKIIGLCVLVLVIAWHAFLLSVERGGFAVGSEWIIYTLTIAMVLKSIAEGMIKEVTDE